MKRYGRGFRAAIVDKPGGCDVAGERGNGYNGAVVAGDDGGKKFPGEAVVRESVNFENTGEEGLRGGEDCVSVCDAGVVDENCRVAVRGADLGCDGGDVGGGREVEAVEIHIGVGWKGSVICRARREW